MAETDAEGWDSRLGEAARRFERDAGVIGGTWARRDDNAFGRLGQQFVNRRPVVADDLNFSAELTEILDKVVGEGVVVVDHQRSHTYHQPGWLVAISIAPITAFALLTDSSYSYCGLASATVPPPACTCTLPSRQTTVRMWMQVSRSPA